MGSTSLGGMADQIPLVGIARMAAQSPLVRERAEVEYFRLPARSTLNRESSGRMPFAWTINPYRGCEFGCHYCYARYTHEFMEMWDSRDFERKIYAKTDAPERLRAELRQGRDKGLPIALGTATDPYQPAERQFEITRRMLEVFAEFRGLDLSITTKSVLILRDLDLLQSLAARHRFSVHMTVTTHDERLARLLEPKAPPPAQRLEAVRKLAQAGIRVGVNAMPILPGLNDAPRMLEALAAQAAQAGARFLYGNVLFLSTFRHEAIHAVSGKGISPSGQTLPETLRPFGVFAWGVSRENRQFYGETSHAIWFGWQSWRSAPRGPPSADGVAVQRSAWWGG